MADERPDAFDRAVVIEHRRVGFYYRLFGQLYRPQTYPARPTTQNKSGWLGAVTVSGQERKPWSDKHFRANIPSFAHFVF